MKKIFSTFLGIILLSSTEASAATPTSSHYKLFEKIIQCKASTKDIQELNDLLNQKKIPFPESKIVDVWGGKAWDVNPPISFGSVTSSVVVMTTRDGLYLRVKTKGNVHAVMRSVAQDMNVPAQSDRPDTSYLTKSAPPWIHILWSDEKDVYWIGCIYEYPLKPSK